MHNTNEKEIKNQEIIALQEKLVELQHRLAATDIVHSVNPTKSLAEQRTGLIKEIADTEQVIKFLKTSAL